MTGAPRRVAVLGGGVAGLTAAHELACRDFDVTVYEARALLGGKARSMDGPRMGAGALPAEHGFRFFPGFYRHLPDTMDRIPYRRPGRADGRVVDNLVRATRIEIAQMSRRDVVVPAALPTSPAQMRLVLGAAIGNLVGSNPGLTPADLAFFTEKLLLVLGSCSERRLTEFEHTRWWSFTDAARRSRQYQLFLADGLTRTLVAAKAREMSARTASSIMLQLLFCLMTPWGRADRVLNGPSSAVWIDPWRRHLREDLDVRFHLNAVVEAIHCAGDCVTDVAIRHTRTGAHEQVTADHYVAALPAEVMTRLVEAEPRLEQAEPGLGKLRGLRTRWMNGVMFYLRNDVPLVHGHTLYIDSPWALTSISQRQFWTDDHDPRHVSGGEVSGILSVDVSDWETPGELHRLRADECTRQQITEEVWHQLTTRIPELGRAECVTSFLDSDIRCEEDGEHEAVNAEPLLINTPGSWYLRPEARIGIANLVLASDYVRTYTDLATMEGANEAARRAVNAILDASGSSRERCDLWPLREPSIFAPLRALDRVRFERRGPDRAAPGGARVEVNGRPVGPAAARAPARRGAAGGEAEALAGVRHVLAEAAEAGELDGPDRRPPDGAWRLVPDAALGERRSRLDAGTATISYNPGHRDYLRFAGDDHALAEYLFDLAAQEFGLANTTGCPTEEVTAEVMRIRTALRHHRSRRGG